MGETVPGDLLRGHCTSVSLIAATIESRVAVENLAIDTRSRNADAITGAHDRRKIAYADELSATGRRDTHEGDHVLIGIVVIDPLETRRLVVFFAQRRLGAIDTVEIADQALNAAMVGLVEQIPIETGVVIPFAPLAKLSPHKENFFPRARPHVAEQRAQVGELLPAITGHLVEQRALSVNDLVVGQRQHKIFEPGVDKSEGQIAMMKSAKDRLLAKVVERVMHPSHVPLEAETKTADIHGTADPGPRSGLLGNHHHAGMARVDLQIHLLEK